MKEFLESETVGLDLDKRILVHNYKDFKKTDWGKEQLEKYLDRWGKLGFIDGLDGEIRERCALAMEQLAQFLIFEATEDDSINDFETIGFPMVRRILGTREKLNDLDSFKFETFLKYCREIDVRKLEEKLVEISRPLNHIDVEAEACAMASEMIIKKFNGDERSFDEIETDLIDEIKDKLEKRDEGTSNE